MAKGSKDDTGRSVLRAAFAAFDRGDAVEARRLARAVLSGQKGPDDEKAARELASRLSAEGAPVADTVEAVAAELADRTVTPPKTYLLFLAVLAAFIGLVGLATARY